MAFLEQTYYLPSPASFVKTGDPDKPYEYQFNPAGVTAIKDQLMAGHGVGMVYHADTAMPGQTGEGKYLNYNTYAQYTYESDKEGVPSARTNHVVCIVGWDDDYPKENFIEGHEPPGDGAFIVKNSWGALDSETPNRGDWGVDGNGYFYLSYYDKSPQLLEVFDFVTENDDDLLYGKTETEGFQPYLYDFMPSGYQSTRSYDNVVSQANVFTMETPVVLRTVSTKTQSQDTDVRFDVYRLNDGATLPTDGTLLWSKDSHFDYGGYHRVEIDTPIAADEGERLAVVVTTQAQDGTYEVTNQGAFSEETSGWFSLPPMAIEPAGDIQPWGNAVINPGESFVGAPASRLEYGDGSMTYGDYQWNDLVDVIAERKAETAGAIDQTTIPGLVAQKQELVDQLAAITSAPTTPEEQQELAATMQKLTGIIDELVGTVNSLEGDALDAAIVIDNNPIALNVDIVDDVSQVPAPETVEMLRVYNPNTGEHLYTSNAGEQASLVNRGWTDEGTGWTAPKTSNTSVYRLYNQYSGEHLYTSSKNERDTLLGFGWNDEGVGFHSDFNHSNPVYRLFNPYGAEVSSHHYTTDAAERDNLIKLGWRYEGIAWYGV